MNPSKKEQTLKAPDSKSPAFLFNRLLNLYQAHQGSSVSDKELAGHFGVNTSTLSRWKNGEVEPEGVDFLLRLLKETPKSYWDYPLGDFLATYAGGQTKRNSGATDEMPDLVGIPQGDLLGATHFILGQTGSGKTMFGALPMLQACLQGNAPKMGGLFVSLHGELTQKLLNLFINSGRELSDIKIISPESGFCTYNPLQDCTVEEAAEKLALVSVGPDCEGGYSIAAAKEYFGGRLRHLLECNRPMSMVELIGQLKRDVASGDSYFGMPSEYRDACRNLLVRFDMQEGHLDALTNPARAINLREIFTNGALVIPHLSSASFPGGLHLLSMLLEDFYCVAEQSTSNTDNPTVLLCDDYEHLTVLHRPLSRHLLRAAHAPNVAQIICANDPGEAIGDELFGRILRNAKTVLLLRNDDKAAAKWFNGEQGTKFPCRLEELALSPNLAEGVVRMASWVSTCWGRVKLPAFVDPGTPHTRESFSLLLAKQGWLAESAKWNFYAVMPFAIHLDPTETAICDAARATEAYVSRMGPDICEPEKRPNAKLHSLWAGTSVAALPVELPVKETSRTAAVIRWILSGSEELLALFQQQCAKVKPPKGDENWELLLSEKHLGDVRVVLSNLLARVTPEGESTKIK